MNPIEKYSPGWRCNMKLYYDKNGREETLKIVRKFPDDWRINHLYKWLNVKELSDDKLLDAILDDNYKASIYESQDYDEQLDNDAEDVDIKNEQVDKKLTNNLIIQYLQYFFKLSSLLSSHRTTDNNQYTRQIIFGPIFMQTIWANWESLIKAFKYIPVNSYEDQNNDEGKFTLNTLIDNYLQFYINAFGRESISKEHPLDLNWIDTSKIENMSHLFNNIMDYDNLYFDISKWDTKNVTEASNMFGKKIYADCSKLDLSNVKQKILVFNNSDLPDDWKPAGFDISDRTPLYDEFLKDIITNTYNPYYNDGNKRKEILDEIMANHNYKYKVKRSSDLMRLINKISKIQSIDSQTPILYGNLNWIDVSNLTMLFHVFDNVTITDKLNMDQWDVSNVKEIESLFINVKLRSSRCISDIQYWKFSSLKKIQGMFNIIGDNNKLKELDIKANFVNNIIDNKNIVINDMFRHI